MELDILDCDKWVVDNNIPEVTSSNIYSTKSSEPDPEGLGSYEIFGRPGTEERKRTYGYIDLINKFVHPHCYYELCRLQRNIKDLIAGTSDFYVDSFGKLKEIKNDEPAPKGVLVGTGVKFLYKVWDKLDFSIKPDTAKGTAMRYKFFNSLSKNEIFISKIPVIPPFYRDIDVTNRKKNEINTMYIRILVNASTLRATAGMFDIFGVSSSEKKIQETLLELYSYFIDVCGGNKGFIHKHVMGKPTDFSARAVISMPNFDKVHYSDSSVSFDSTGIPLSTVCKCFSPFIKFGIKKIIERVLSGNKFINVIKNDGSVERVEISSTYKSYFSSEYIEKLIDLYDESYEHRQDIFKIKCENGKEYPLFYIKNNENLESEDDEIDLTDENVSELIGRKNKFHPVNMTEILYMAAYDMVRDKCIYITRYPVEDHNNIYPSKMNILSTKNTSKKTVLGITYPNFPIIPEGENISHIYVETLQVFPSYLDALGGDFDGDQVSIQGVFTEEANESSKKFIESELNILSVNNNTMRNLKDVCQIGLYNLTYRFEQ